MDSICRGMNELGDDSERHVPELGHVKARVLLDVEVLKTQIDTLMDLALSRFPDGVPDEFIHNLLGLGSEILFGESVSALGTDGVSEITFRLQFGSRFEDFLSALRAVEGKSWVRHRLNSTAVKHREQD